MYVKKTYDMGWIKQVHKYYPGNYGAPGCKRSKRRKRTPDEIIQQNMTNRVNFVQRLILANFKEGDWHLILTFKKELRPSTYQETKKIISKFLNQMRNCYKKENYPFKYIYVIEKGKRGACHYHFVIEDISSDRLNTKKAIMKYWPYGNKSFIPLYEDGEYKKLAEYIVKKETKEENEGYSYSRSRNLIVPKAKKEKIHRRKWKRDPVEPKGWYIVKESVVNRINKYTGYPYQKYTLIKIDPGGRGS